MALKLYWTDNVEAMMVSTDTTPDSNSGDDYYGAPMDLDTLLPVTGTFPTTGWWIMWSLCVLIYPILLPIWYMGELYKYATDGATFETVVKENGSTEGGYSQFG